MDTVRKYGTGTYVDGVWRLKEKKDRHGKTIRPNIAASLKQLGELFKVTLTNKPDSLPYWNKYRKAALNYHAKKQGENSLLQERIRSLEALIADFKLRGRDTTQLETELAEARAVPGHGIEFGKRPTAAPTTAPLNLETELCEALADSVVDIHHSDGPAIHPDIRPAAELLAATHELDEVAVAVLNSFAPKPIPKLEALKTELDAAIERAKSMGGKSWFTVRQYPSFCSSRK